jgi:ligand-binding sensor domain-containing protein
LGKIFYILVIIFSLSTVDSGAQIPPFKHFTTANGLCNNTVYTTYQDKSHFLWFATEGGVSGFDGTAFKNYTKSDGLNSNTVTGILESDKGPIFINYVQTHNLLKDGAIQSITGCPKISTIASAFQSEDYIYLVSGGGYFVVQVGNFLADCITNNAQPEKIQFEINGLSRSFSHTFYCSQSILFELHGKESALIYPSISDRFTFESAHKNDRGDILLAGKSGVRIVSNGTIKNIPLDYQFNNIKSCFLDNTGKAWIINDDKAFVIINDCLIDLNEQLSIGNTIVNSLFSDYDGNIWITTTGKGVFMFYNLYCLNIGGSDLLVNNSINAIYPGKGEDIVIGTRKGIDVIDGKFNVTNLNAQNFIYDLVVDSGKIYCASTNQKIQSDATLDYEIINFVGSGLLYDNHALRYVAKLGCLEAVENNLKASTISIRLNDQSGNSERYDAIEVLESDKLLIGGRNGLIEYDITTGKPTRLIDEKGVLESHVHEIYKDKTNQLLWVAADNGIIQYKGGIWKSITYLNNPIYTFSANTVEPGLNGNVWVGTNHGLVLLNKEMEVLKILDRSAGLKSDEITSLENDTINNRLLIGTSDGVSVLSLEEFNAHVVRPPYIALKIAEQNGIDFSAQELNTTEFERGSLRFFIQSISLSELSELVFEYSVDEQNPAQISHREIQLNSIEGGNHTLAVRCRSLNSEWSSWIEIPFRIRKPIYAQWWFFLLSIVSFSLLTILFVQWRITKHKKYVEKENKVRQEIANLRQIALASSVNPHFIFNTLNSIQLLVNLDDGKKANDYIARFAKLMRSVLNSGQQNYVRLSEELDVLKNYLELEKLRLGDKLNWIIEIESSIEPSSIDIPNMILQPFVENAIWHGIARLAVSGEVKILISRGENESLVFRIIDNGPGLYHDNQQKKSHPSKGVEIIRERLLLLGKSKENNPVEIRNRSDQHQGVESVIRLFPEVFREKKTTT